MSEQRKTVVCRDLHDLALRLARKIQRFADILEHRPFQIALSGGNTPKHLYKLLAGEAFRKEVRWSGLEFFFGDERAVPPDHPESNFGMAQRVLLAKVDVVAHRMMAESGSDIAYQTLIHERVEAAPNGVPVFDLILLGIGTDGHTASLFPGTTATMEMERWVVMNEVPQLNTQRMTFTFPLINAARRVWILAPGREKKEMVEACFNSPGDRNSIRSWPVLGVRPTRGELIWWLDRASSLD